MATKAPTDPRLTKLQLAVLQVLWNLEEASVAQVQEALSVDRRLALTTVGTLLSRLEQRGVVSRRTEGRQYLYRARLAPDRLQGSVVRNLLQTLFQGDITAFISHLLDARHLTREELTRLQQLVRAKEKDSRAG